jgi:hypothetical protein
MQKRAYGSLIWGGFLILLGLFLLAQNLNWLGDWTTPVWSLILGVIGLFFLAVFLGDRQQWWALIPALTILGIAAAIFLAEQDIIADYVVATIILAGIGLPFLLIFLTDRQHWWALIPGLTMTGSAAAVFLEGINLISGEAVGGIIVGGISLGFLIIYVLDRRQWWALIPGGVLGTVAVFLLLAAAAGFIWPVVLILLGLLLLRGSLGGGRRRTRRIAAPAAPMPPPDLDAPVQAVEPAKPKRQRLPTLEEQIEAAIADMPEVPAEVKEVSTPEAEEEKDEPPADMPPAPEMPQPPEVPSGPDIA